MNGFDPGVPYNNLPLLPPAVELETRRVLVKTISAGRALAQLNGALIHLPNPHLFLDSIYVLEAKASSEVENILTTNDDLYQSTVVSHRVENPAVREVLRYKEALWLGLTRLEDRPLLTTNLFIEIVQCIKQNQSGIRKVPGTTLVTPDGKVIYTPPSGEDVIRQMLSNLEQFIHEENELDPLIKMAVIHYQFEAVHPFVDGNGRTGRILLLLYLKFTGMLDVPAIFLSEYIIRNKSEYYRRLRQVTENGNWEDYLLYMLDMVKVTSRSAFVKLQSITQLMDLMSDEIQAALPRVYSRELMDVLFRLPYVKRDTLVEAGLGTKKTVGTYLMDLEKKGFLTWIRLGKEKLYLNYRLMDVLKK
ncbi:MAG: Fic family protein [Saprospiraceae bacterium]|nr:Fic family protein [Saprospiraceae bacterium]